MRYDMFLDLIGIICFPVAPLAAFLLFGVVIIFLLIVVLQREREREREGERKREIERER